MNIEKINEEENPLLHRKEIELKIEGYEETPNRQEVMKNLSAELGYKEENTVISRIKQEYGKREAKCELEVYESKEYKDRYSEKYKTERNKKEED